MNYDKNYELCYAVLEIYCDPNLLTDVMYLI